jgi:hypothetical protein
MNIYVVSTVWHGEGSTVIGAATDRPGAEVIADRSGKWAPWREVVDPAEGSCTWERLALMPDGVTVDPMASQEIVCVPLAGMMSIPGEAYVPATAVAGFGADLIAKMNGGLIDSEAPGPAVGDFASPMDRAKSQIIKDIDEGLLWQVTSPPD